MKSFLEYVADDILSKYGTDLSRLTVVFPNKRAALFLNDYLARQAGKPVWSPAYITISDLFRRHSTLKVADPVKLVCELHKSFTTQTGIDETLDHFFGWGELLLADFDDIDKQMADADHVLANITDLHEMDDNTFLTEEQRQVLRRFFSNFTDDRQSELRQRFIRLWAHLADIYHDFNKRLAAQGLAYEGALYRKVVEDLGRNEDAAVVNSKLNTPNSKIYIFVGFNVLLRVEQQLFTLLRRQGQARFYWDFDDYYMPHGSRPSQQEAGHFISQYLADFPNELDSTDHDIYHNFLRPKRLHIASATTENIQARYAASWLQADPQRISDGRQTAIVLCNEALLPAVIHCLPEQVGSVNITTGYPLAQSPVASLVSQLIALRRDGYDRQRGTFRYRYRTSLLRHPLLAAASPELQTLLFQQPTPLYQNEELLVWLCQVLQHLAHHSSAVQGDDQTAVLNAECLFRTYTLLNRLLTLTRGGDLQTDIVTLSRLVTQLLQTASVPFHGEPAEGLQVMGILETRNLDFTHLLILSTQEGNMPRGETTTSFIPYSLRRAYGLTTPEHHTAIYSYYFHRLLQRATDITIVYNNATTDGQKGEMSRFLLQLMVEYPNPISRLTLQGYLSHQLRLPQPVANEAKPPSLLTPTAINTYMRCPLMFHYRYVRGLQEPDDPDDDTIDNRIFGNIFHEAACTIYTRMMQANPVISATAIDEQLKDRAAIERAVDEAFRQEVKHLHEAGLVLINRQVIIHYLRQLLTLDRQLTPFTILSLEGDVSMPLDVPSLPGGSVTIGGRVDRMDMVTTPDGDSLVRVIDYKTGPHRLKALSGVDAVFAQESLKDHSDYYLQAMLYSLVVASPHPDRKGVSANGLPVAPALLFIQHAGAEGYDPLLHFGPAAISDVSLYAQPFTEKLRQTIAAMYDHDTPLKPTEDRQRCRYCPYRQLCY